MSTTRPNSRPRPTLDAAASITTPKMPPTATGKLGLFVKYFLSNALDYKKTQMGSLQSLDHNFMTL